MKTGVFVFLFVLSLYIFSCANNTSTEDPNGGYKERSDSTTAVSTDSTIVPKDKGAVGVDTIKNGQAVISGSTSDSAH